MSSPSATGASSAWPHYPLHRAAAQTMEASDLVALSAQELVALSSRSNRSRRVITARTFHALQQTQAMLEQAAQSLTRARTTFAPLGLTRSPF